MPSYPRHSTSYKAECMHHVHFAPTLSYLYTSTIMSHPIILYLKKVLADKTIVPEMKVVSCTSEDCVEPLIQ